eukprot:9027047-Lingulodinium_polyedra.AAC.1
MQTNSPSMLIPTTHAATAKSGATVCGNFRVAGGDDILGIPGNAQNPGYTNASKPPQSSGLAYGYT